MVVGHSTCPVADSSLAEDSPAEGSSPAGRRNSLAVVGCSSLAIGLDSMLATGLVDMLGQRRNVLERVAWDTMVADLRVHSGEMFR